MRPNETFFKNIKINNLQLFNRSVLSFFLVYSRSTPLEYIDVLRGNNRSTQRKWPQTPEVSRCPLVNHGVWHLPTSRPPTCTYTLWILLFLMPSALKGKNESHHLPFPFSPLCHIHFDLIQFGSHPQTDWGIAFQSLICCNEKREGAACECGNRISGGRRGRHRPFEGEQMNE